ncbi:endonuclease/exonuclease/phosphatase family protein [Neptunitalea lumnitzerae]|uniref:Endonuclease/exonuclease/phosphatase domain-containing protein n=1 Tax=Neptunitalea lumnitzerae TaxID=2965509 RepID=A0ABQ5MM79_9FLAO|nr:endonuclease/exonuclease/phosphatase family protein [Neptunitalea sp. Y10]GLB50484.1 hypothetical protein Y10_28520 [Neptunitalea sp. Y10]
MPFYKDLKNLPKEDRLRIIDGLQRMRAQLIDVNFPHKKAAKSLILGTWNIRNFDDDRFNYGPRTEESLYYLAEIMACFDVIAIQEICIDLKPLKRLIQLLGDDVYDYIVTDVSHYSSGGSNERLGFIYDKTKVQFTGVAGEIVLPDKMLISEENTKKRQFSRTPFGVDFKSGWFNFYFSTVHIYYGSNSGNTPQYKRRVEEINAVAAYLAKEAKNSESNHILVGDFNIKQHGSEGYNALQKNGFTVINNRKGSNRDRTKYYDQISFRSKRNELRLLEPDREDRVITFFDSVYREEDFELYKPVMTKMILAKIENERAVIAATTSKTKIKKAEKKIASMEKAMLTDENFKEYYDEWRSFQMSDHLPLWVEIEIDFSDAYLRKLKTLP